MRARDPVALLRERAMSHAKIVDVIRQVGAGITVAGAAGIIHRDLKPQNVFLAGTTWKILDFGVSRIADTGSITVRISIRSRRSHIARSPDTRRSRAASSLTSSIASCTPHRGAHRRSPRCTKTSISCSPSDSRSIRTMGSRSQSSLRMRSKQRSQANSATRYAHAVVRSSPTSPPRHRTLDPDLTSISSRLRQRIRCAAA